MSALVSARPLFPKQLGCRGPSGFFPSSREVKKLAFLGGIAEDSRLALDGPGAPGSLGFYSFFYNFLAKISSPADAGDEILPSTASTRCTINNLFINL